MINSLVKSYAKLVDSGLVVYKSPPKGASGSPVLSLDMGREGIFLSFWRAGRIIKAITLTIQEDNSTDWMFPDDLPAHLEKQMTRPWVHDHPGEPLTSIPSKVIMKRNFGCTNLYEAKDWSVSTSMQINYDVTDSVRPVTFMPISELRR
ncbi:DUF6392 family protein [Pantoea sp. C2G6]|uniref:DUF6392 family protein n=1 Tax=Pantoea sp. C2G6 TaxID=3243084 RepID=UPI003EDA7F0B